MIREFLTVGSVLWALAGVSMLVLPSLPAFVVCLISAALFTMPARRAMAKPFNKADLPLPALLGLAFALCGVAGAVIEVPATQQQANHQQQAEKPPKSTPTDAPNLVYFDIPKIAGKTPAQVKAVLGEPVSEESSKYGPKLNFKGPGGGVEIVFINGLADWITVNDIGTGVRMDSLAVSAFGLDGKTFLDTPQRINWDVPGYVSVSLFGSNKVSDYLYVKHKTK